MRSFLRFAGGVLLASVGLGHLACTGTPATSAPTAAAAASDAGAPESGTVEVPDDPNLVKVGVVESFTGLPIASATVYYYDASGTYLGSADPGADGLAAFDLPEGGQVTVVAGTAEKPQLVTFLGVKARDRLTAAIDRVAADARFAYDVTLPRDAPVGTTATKLAIGTCAESLAGVTVSVAASCFSPGVDSTVHLVALQNLTPLGSIALPGPPNLDGSAVKLSFLGLPWDAIAGQDRAVTVVDAPINEDDIEGPTLTLTHLLGAGRATFAATQSVGLKKTSTLNFLGSPLAFAGAEFQQDAVATVGPGQTAGSKEAHATAVRGKLSITNSFSFGSLPSITGVDVQGKGAPRLSLKMAADIADAKGIVAEVRFTVGSDPLAGSWRFVGPAASGFFGPPQLPSFDVMHAPPFGFTKVTVAVFAGTAVADYDGFRSSSLATLTPALREMHEEQMMPLLPGDGDMHLVALTTAP